MNPANDARLTLLADAILSVPAGRVRCVFGVGFADAAAALDEATATEASAIGLIIETAPAVDGAVLADRVIATLAATALNLWPLWWSDIDFGAPERFDRRTARLRLAGADTPPEVSRSWAERAVLLAASGQPPLVPDFPRAEQLRQLALAVHRAGVVIAFVAEDEAAPDAALIPLMHAAEWIARHAGRGVALLLPAALEARAVLERVTFGARAVPSVEIVVVERTEMSPPIDLVVPSGGPAAVALPPQARAKLQAERAWLGPLIGQPHPSSPGELRLAAAIRNDPALAPLFTFNVHVDTVLSLRPLVDAVWAGGRVVIEVDSYRYHGDEAAFTRDRERDYQLIVSGYLVLRLVYEDIMADVQLALAKVRKVVALRRVSGGAP